MQRHLCLESASALHNQLPTRMLLQVGHADTEICPTLCSNRLDKQLNDSELKEALTLLDAGKTGFVQFADFVEWYQGLRPDKATRERAASLTTSTED